MTIKQHPTCLNCHGRGWVRYMGEKSECPICHGEGILLGTFEESTPPQKQEPIGVEEAAEREFPHPTSLTGHYANMKDREAFKKGAKWQSTQQAGRWTDQDLCAFAKRAYGHYYNSEERGFDDGALEQLLEKYKSEVNI